MGGTYEPRLSVVYRPKIVAPKQAGFSRSPLEPALWLRHIEHTALAPFVDVHPEFGPIDVDDLRQAHTEAYVRAFLRGTPRGLAESGGNGWSQAYRNSVLMKVGALVHACELAVQTRERIVVCPTSGDHHATPSRGAGFCPVAGQVIAARRLFQRWGLRTAWIDLDEHFGNAIPDSAAWCAETGAAVPFNVNPRGTHGAYLDSLSAELSRVEEALVSGAVDLVAVGHGADSHEWDELGGSLTTSEWVEAARRTYGMVRRAAERRGRCIPLVTSFFGGYRQDDYPSVLELHSADVATALEVLSGRQIGYHPQVQRPLRRALGVL